METTSTIDEARRRASAGAPHGTTVIADSQTAGRGRHGRTWHTLPGRSLAATVVLRETPSRFHLGMAGMAAAIAVVRAADRVAHVRLQTKWPNDVVWRGRKVAGTLAETLGDALLLSIGLNVNGGEADLPPELRETAATLEMAAGAPFDRQELAQAIFVELEAAWQRLMEQPGRLVRVWNTLDTTFGAELRVTMPDGGVLHGTGEGADPLGRLRVRAGDGTECVVAAGDVTLVQTAPSERGPFDEIGG